ncbi:putative transcription factor ILR3 [Helianthus annuus]|nr:putative transcription factor ILR3 [Helianthus annuus]
MPLGFTFWYSYPVSALINSQNARNKYFLVFFIFSIFFSNINGFMFKAEKNELREEKLVLKTEKAKMELQVKSVTSNIPPPGFMAPHPAAFQAGANKMPVFPGYGYIPMWQYLPPSTCDTSHDHELRPPAA